MRTTLTLDADVAAYIEKVRREEGLALKDVINSMLREAIQPRRRATKGKPYQTPAHKGGKCARDLTDISDAIAEAEGEWRR